MQSSVSLFFVLVLLTAGLQASADNAANADCTAVSTHILPTVTNTIDLPTSTLGGRSERPPASSTTLTSITQSTVPASTSKASGSTSVPPPPPQSTGSGGIVVASAFDLQRRSVLQLSALLAVIGGVLVA